MITSAVGHVLAVTLYAAVLSSSGNMELGSMAWTTALVAFLIQAALALGRLAGGVLSDRRPIVVGFAALSVLALASTGFILSSSELAVILTSVLVGFGSGIGQTAALTAMMRRAQDSASTERVSAVWNIGFDIGLGAGALTAGAIVSG